MRQARHLDAPLPGGFKGGARPFARQDGRPRWAGRPRPDEPGGAQPPSSVHRIDLGQDQMPRINRGGYATAPRCDTPSGGRTSAARGRCTWSRRFSAAQPGTGCCASRV